MMTAHSSLPRSLGRHHLISSHLIHRPCQWTNDSLQVPDDAIGYILRASITGEEMETETEGGPLFA